MIVTTGAWIAACISLFQRLDLEYEYLFVNGELDIDKIMCKVKKKTSQIFEFEQNEI
ncbi:MAG: DUF6106 family protein [Blautia caecimuris]